MPTLLLATTNQNKLREYAAYLFAPCYKRRPPPDA